MKRIESIDITRGIVMTIMSLDHVRDLMHVHSVASSPTDLSTTTPLLFFTRWITYLCAPAFVFLAGVSARLYIKKNDDVHAARTWLLKRGLWLIVVEFTVVNFGIQFDPGFHIMLFEVIAAIGTGFILVSLFTKASAKRIAVAGFFIIFLHDLTSRIPAAPDSVMRSFFLSLFNLSVFPFDSNRAFVMAYPPLPWLGIMLVGYAFGSLFEKGQQQRKKLCLQMAAACLSLFVILRLVNVYGNPTPWSIQKNTTYTFLSLMDVSKYPPSLLFCMVTLGIMFLILALAERKENRFLRIASVYGKVPLFYFVVHFYLIHVLLILLLLMQGVHWADMHFADGNFGRPKNMSSGVSLSAVYLIWIVVVVVLYRPCVWFGNYKKSHTQWWLKYI